ncbi:hypothetical protein DFQ27_003604 [Actinomortierella ambigua]|uniref:Transmembrane protein n=1 Tax=Actinomortierella ambigua TaxID=1343610 RepID=A0A9P6U4L2_9FUNG|nr:hypothetical protein DFQ27_003604 [Actinomortierella ambigua]
MASSETRIQKPQYGPQVNSYYNPIDACFTSTSNAFVGLTSEGIRSWSFYSTPKDFSRIADPNPSGVVVACASTKDYIIAVVPDSNGVTSRPAIQLYNIKKARWSKAKLVEAPPGTFSDLPPPPPPPPPPAAPPAPTNPGGDPSKAGPGGSPGGGEGSAKPSPGESSPSANESSSHTALIVGIVGGVVFLGALFFAGFFFGRRRRRGANQNQTAQHRKSEFSPKPLASDDTFHEDPQFHESDRDTNSGSDGRRPTAYEHYEMSRQTQAYNQYEASWPGAINQPQEMPLPPGAYNQHEAARPGANNQHQEMYWRAQAYNQHEAPLPGASNQVDGTILPFRSATAKQPRRFAKLPFLEDPVDRTTVQ